MTFPILASLLVRLVVLLPFQLLRLSLATPSRWTPLALSVFLHCVVALLFQRLMNAMRQAHADGWFIVFDTLTLADDRLEAFYDNPNALRDYFRDIGRMVLAAEGRKANDSHADCYQYFCVPEYGTANGRLHF